MCQVHRPQALRKGRAGLSGFVFESSRTLHALKLFTSAPPTAARRISYSESLRFERIHENEYARLGFELIDIGPGTPQARADLIGKYVDEYVDERGR